MCWVPPGVLVDRIDRPRLGLTPTAGKISPASAACTPSRPTRAIGTDSPPRPSSTSSTWPSASSMAEITTSGPAGICAAVAAGVT
jgi:hypothetical protein